MSDDRYTDYLDGDYTAPSGLLDTNVFIDEGLPFFDICLVFKLASIELEFRVVDISISARVKT